MLNSDDYDTFTAGTNTSAMNIRVDMKTDDGDLGRFWFVGRDCVGMRNITKRLGANSRWLEKWVRSWGMREWCV